METLTIVCHSHRLTGRSPNDGAAGARPPSCGVLPAYRRSSTFGGRGGFDGSWLLINLVIALTAALAGGLIAARLGLGYVLAGIAIGPYTPGLAVLSLGVAASALAFWLWHRALMVLDVGQASAFVNLVPLVGVVSAAVVLSEPLTPIHVLGGGLILLGVGLCLR